MSVGYAIMSGELPGEGVWCQASTYPELKACVQRTWGLEFEPIFKYKLPCSEYGAAEEQRYHRPQVSLSPSPTAKRVSVGRGAGSPASASTSMLRSKSDHSAAPSSEAFAYDEVDLKHFDAGMRGMCYVIIEDDDDFDIWLRGGLDAAWQGCPDPSTECTEGLFHRVDYHMNNGIAEPSMYDTEKKIDVVGPVKPLTDTLFAFRSREPSLLLQGAPVQMRKVQRSGCPQRSSPPVKMADDTVIRVPIHSLLSPQLLLQLRVSVVLRHSNASEVILWSDRAWAGEGCHPWGALCSKARAAWGVHSPQFRYVDLRRGVTQMLINNVIDYGEWVRQIRLGRNELLVVEKAPDAAELAWFTSPEGRRAIETYYRQIQPQPSGPLYPSTLPPLEVLMKRLKDLERESRIEEVNRFTPIPAQVLSKSLYPKPLSLQEKEAGALCVVETVEPSSRTATPPALPAPDDTASLQYNPILLAQRRAITVNANGSDPAAEMTAAGAAHGSQSDFAQWMTKERFEQLMSLISHTKGGVEAAASDFPKEITIAQREQRPSVSTSEQHIHTPAMLFTSSSDSSGRGETLPTAGQDDLSNVFSSNNRVSRDSATDGPQSRPATAVVTKALPSPTVPVAPAAADETQSSADHFVAGKTADAVKMEEGKEEELEPASEAHRQALRHHRIIQRFIERGPHAAFCGGTLMKGVVRTP